MELAEYLSRIWARKWIILGVMVLVVCLDLGVLFLIPRHYTATATLESGGIQTYLTNPGTVRDTGRQSVPSTIQPITQKYLKIIIAPSVKEEAVSRMQNMSSSAEDQGASGSVNGDAYPQQATNGTPVSGDFTYTAYAEFIRESDSDLIYIEASADQPEVAKRAADTLAGILMVKSTELGGDTAKQFIDSINKQQLDPINVKLDANRRESEQLKANNNIDAVERNVRLARLEDESKALTDSRKQYTDLVARVQVNESLNSNNLRFLFPAVQPDSKEKPNIVKNSMIAVIIGFLVGVIGVAALDRRSLAKDSSIF